MLFKAMEWLQFILLRKKGWSKWPKFWYRNRLMLSIAKMKRLSLLFIMLEDTSKVKWWYFFFKSKLCMSYVYFFWLYTLFIDSLYDSLTEEPVWILWILMIWKTVLTLLSMLYFRVLKITVQLYYRWVLLLAIELLIVSAGNNVYWKEAIITYIKIDATLAPSVHLK